MPEPAELFFELDQGIDAVYPLLEHYILVCDNFNPAGVFHANEEGVMLDALTD